MTSAQYSVTAWGHKDGLPSTFIYSIAQTADGFLWLGTGDGLVRFDGVQFTPWHTTQPNEAPLGEVHALRACSGGDLLVGTGTGTLGRLQGGRMKTVALQAGVEWIEEARDGTLWVATSKAVWHTDGTNLAAIDPPIALPGDWLSGPLEDADGRQWITTRKGVFRVGAENRLAPAGAQPAWLMRFQDGRLALLDASGVARWVENGKMIWQVGRLLPRAAAISGATADREGTVWIALRGNGVIRVGAPEGLPSAERFTRNDGVSSDFVRGVFEDSERDLWIATENGLNRLQRNNVLSLTRREGLISDTVTSIAEGEDGSLWLGAADGLERMADGKQAAYLQGTRVLSLASGKGALWAGTTRGLMQWKDGHMSLVRQDAKFKAITTLAEDSSGMLWFYDAGNGLFHQMPGRSPELVTDRLFAHDAVTAMCGARDGQVWIGLFNGDIVAYRDGAFRSYSTQEGLRGGEVHGLAEGAAGELWASTERGLCDLIDGRFDCRNALSGLPGDRVLWALPDASGNMWLGYNIGVARMDLHELRGTKAEEGEKPRWKLYDARDGVENSPAVKGSAPAVLTHDGHIWLTTSQGVAVLDPARFRTNPLPPPVHIEDFEADGEEIDLSQQIRLRPLTRSIQFSFTGLSLSDPRRMHFQYRLDGFDQNWREVGLRRDVSYTNLPPRRYAFHVRAANSDGVWNNTGATLEFILAPAYFQTYWFIVLCILTALACVVILFRMRLRSAKRNMRMRYEERIEERARIAQELHDHLIQEMVGIGMQLETADALTPVHAGAKRPLERAVTLSRSAIASGRLTLQTLRSRPTTGPALVETMRTTAEAYERAGRASVQYFVEGEDRTLCPEVGEEVSEIGQEALRNALKHAGSGAITVRLHFGTLLLDLRVRDEGSGIDEAVLSTGVPGHYGLAGMRERAARISAAMTIESAPGRGTTVHVSVPAQRAYDNGPGADAAARKRWSLWRPWRRWREEKMK